MQSNIKVKGEIEQFPGYGGWIYITVPKKYTKDLSKHRSMWGMFPIKARVGQTSWKTKLMMKKGGDYFVALKAEVRKKENLIVGNSVSVLIQLLENQRK